MDGCSPRYFDPNVLYDEASDRFIVGIDVRGEGYCIAASATADPTGAWNRYFIPMATLPDFFDFPQAGVGRDAIYLGGTTFLADGTTDGPVLAIRKQELYAAPRSPWRRRLGRRRDRPAAGQPARLPAGDLAALRAALHHHQRRFRR